MYFRTSSPIFGDLLEYRVTDRSTWMATLWRKRFKIFMSPLASGMVARTVGTRCAVATVATLWVMRRHWMTRLHSRLHSRLRSRLHSRMRVRRIMRKGGVRMRLAGHAMRRRMRDLVWMHRHCWRENNYAAKVVGQSRASLLKEYLRTGLAQKPNCCGGGCGGGTFCEDPGADMGGYDCGALVPPDPLGPPPGTVIRGPLMGVGPWK